MFYLINLQFAHIRYLSCQLGIINGRICYLLKRPLLFTTIGLIRIKIGSWVSAQNCRFPATKIRLAKPSISLWHGPLARYAKLWVRMRRECRERFPPPSISKETDSLRSRHASRHVRDARAVMHVGIDYPRWRGKRSRHSRRMRVCNFTYLARGP